MARTLEDMKRDRGGHCRSCGSDIMSPKQLDHTFCNACWDRLTKHPYTEYTDMYGETGCDFCDEPQDATIHQVARNDEPELLDTFSRIVGI
jgi:hypothetical protein